MSICQIYDLCAETLWLGRYGENGARDIAIDVGRWFADLGTEGTVVLVNWRPGEDDTPYNPNVTMDGSRVVWSPSNIDLAISGRGFAELRYYVGNALAKSKTFRTVIDRTPSEGANPPSAAEDWVERMEQAAVTAQNAAEDAEDAAETATEGAQAVAAALPTVTQAAQTATTAAATATNAATEAAASEEVASAAANAAQTASESATAASQTAVNSATTATTKAAQAVEAAGTATTKASEATQAATTATANAQTSTAKAGEATTAATTAISKATEATTAASTASAAATTATGAASTATSAASTATAAKTAAQTAQTGAETAQTAAESAAASVSASAEQIETNKQDITELKTDFSELESITTETQTLNIPVALDIQTGYYRYNGTFVSESGRESAIVSPVASGEKYKITCGLGSTAIYGVIFRSGNSTKSAILPGTGTQTKYTDYEFTVPDGCDSMIVQTAYRSVANLALKKTVEETTINAYTKAETDALLGTAMRYGVKWEISNPDDLGQRCFGAVGRNATIGIGPENGQSDFDNVYPWSEIRRCNIKQNANGAKIITYEGESGFALDGSNGDVFVRVPKFYYERYRENGYEYRVISAFGVNPHPAFVEGGKVLDEIFVGAYEGVIADSKLRSFGGAIPSSNAVAQTFLDSAEANGVGYTLYDLRTVDAIWNLLAVEFGCRNTSRVLGYGYADYLQPMSGRYGIDSDSTSTSNTFSASKTVSAGIIAEVPAGTNCTICKGTQDNIIATRTVTGVTSDTDHWYITFDGDPVELDTTCFIGSAGCTTNFCETVPSGALSWHTGRANWVGGSTTKNPVRYRWIENIVGSIWHLLPDVSFDSLQMYACNDITKYSFGAITNGYNPVGDLLIEQRDNGSKGDSTEVNYWVSDLNDFAFGKAYPMGKTWDKSIVSTKAFGAYYYMNPNRVVIANGGGFDHLYRCNMLTNRAWIGLTDKWYLYGARLLYKHID